MAEKLPVRIAPPFGGITRIRFKGSPAPVLPITSSATKLSAKLGLDSQPLGSPAFLNINAE